MLVGHVVWVGHVVLIGTCCVGGTCCLVGTCCFDWDRFDRVGGIRLLLLLMGLLWN